MDRLWAPWRMAYILGDAAPRAAEECIFCSFPAAGPKGYRDHLILVAQPHAFVIMNRFPYNNGHVMVVPRRHVADPGDLSGEEQTAVNGLLMGATRALRAALTPEGFNIGMNLGRVAGAGIADHCHWHIVPRWNGDVNFMPVLGEVKVMGEHLVASYERLVPHLAPLGEGPA